MHAALTNGGKQRRTIINIILSFIVPSHFSWGRGTIYSRCFFCSVIVVSGIIRKPIQRRIQKQKDFFTELSRFKFRWTFEWFLWLIECFSYVNFWLISLTDWMFCFSFIAEKFCQFCFNYADKFFKTVSFTFTVVELLLECLIQIFGQKTNIGFKIFVF